MQIGPTGGAAESLAAATQTRSHETTQVEQQEAEHSHVALNSPTETSGNHVNTTA